MISAKNLSYHFPKEYAVFEDVSFDIQTGEFWGILGANGSGKSTLVELMLGMKKKQHGELYYFGLPVEKFLREQRHRIAYISQDVTLKSNIKIKDFFQLHSTFYPQYSTEDEASLLDYFSIKPEMAIGSLSTGQRNKVQAIACFAANTDILVVDEVTAVLDPKSRHLFFNKLLEYHQKRGKTVILATNIVEDLVGRVEKIIYFNQKKCSIHHHANIDQLFE